MITAYKYITVIGGVIIVFPEPVEGFKNDISLGYSSVDGQGHLCIGESHFVPMEDNLLDAIAETGKIFVSYSPCEDYKINHQGAITIDKVTLGKILAYAEMTQSS